MNKIVFCICFCLFVHSAPVFADDGETFRMGKDGSITIQGHRFADMKRYVQSEYFKKEGKRCGTRSPSSRSGRTAQARSVEHCTAQRTEIKDEYWPVTLTYVLPVWFHVIALPDGTGDISDARIQAQIQVLNEDYGAMADSLGEQGVDTHIRFELAGVTRTYRESWFYEDSHGFAELNYKAALHKDLHSYVNVYTNVPADGNLGYSYFPQDYAGSVLDGIVLLHSVVGGRDNGFLFYDQGRTLVHEMGHYLGLLHTFEGGIFCGNSYVSGDLIVDTAAELTAHYSCTQTYSCGSADPIHNYMNYTDDSCVNHFSSEQANRAVCSLMNYRPAAYRVEADVTLPPLLQLLLLDN